MREGTFLKQNSADWQQFSQLLDSHEVVNSQQLRQLYLKVTDDLAFARTYFPNSQTEQYLNQLALKAHQHVYRTKREHTRTFWHFWKYTVPKAVAEAYPQLLLSLTIFLIAMGIGMLSQAQQPDFVRLVLGDSYVDRTLHNIEQGDPFAIYKSAGQTDMFLAITFNNIYVSFLCFIFGLFFSFGTGYILLRNGIMLGTFYWFFIERGLHAEFWTTVFIHGTLEISAIVVAGAAGFSLGNGILFPGTFSRLYSFRQGAIRGLKIVVGLVPIFITAGFLEGFVTRHYLVGPWLGALIIGLSLLFLTFYFFIYPKQLEKRHE